MASLGALAAFGSSMTWAFASVRYSQASREMGSARVNLARAAVVGPLYFVLAVSVHGSAFFTSVSLDSASWLLLSVLCSYALADNLFFSAARRVGVATALSIASIYPLWAVLVGVIFRGEAFGGMRVLGTTLCVGGVVTLVRLTPTEAPRLGESRGRAGLVLAGLTSVLWAGNTVAVKAASPGLDVVQVNGVRYVIALVLLAAGVGVVRTDGIARPIRWRGLLPAIIADGVFGSSFYVYGLSHSDLAIGATLSSLAPLISVPIAIVAGEERWNGGRLAAIAVTVIGAVTLVVAA